MEEDRQWAIALLEYEKSRCGDCGNGLLEATAPEHEMHWSAELVRCHSCATGQRALSAFANEYPAESRHKALVGMSVIVRRKGDRR